MRIALALLVTAALTFGAAAIAKDAPPFKVETKQEFDDAAIGIKKEMEAGGRYSYVKSDERRKVEEAIDEMGRLFDAQPTVEEMNHETQIKMFNRQELVNSILLSRDRDRLICEQTTSTGSHLKTTSCQTYGDIEDRRAQSRKSIDELRPTDCTGAGCGAK
ncbi:MAG TPA: hypothetical protein VJ696_06995 [Rhodanobacteraceae bacterium]|nr:hypothetical protein [Rhodanobacteraceae bacterium]